MTSVLVTGAASFPCFLLSNDNTCDSVSFFPSHSISQTNVRPKETTLSRLDRGVQPLGHGPVVVYGLVRNRAAQQEVSGGPASYLSFICMYSCSPSLTLPPELRLLSDQRCY